MTEFAGWGGIALGAVVLAFFVVAIHYTINRRGRLSESDIEDARARNSRFDANKNDMTSL